MTPIFPELPRTLGVYTLTRLLEERENTELYEARQTHVDRAVVLEVLRPGATNAEEVTFLTQARNRVATHGIPHVADVFESLRAEGIWFLTQEYPQGSSLADMAASKGELSVLNICRVVSAAAEMYENYLQAGHHAMPMEPSSVYVEDSGEVHFLSPLVEGMPNKPRRQMRALARALKAVCPRLKTPGLGRAITLLHWLKEGVDGTHLTWPEIKETADTIIQQLESNALPESQKSAFTRFRERLGQYPAVQRTRDFLKQWGGYLAASAATIVLLSSIGLQFGMDTPTYAPAANEEAVHCLQNGISERVLRQPVSVQQYAEFMRSLNTMKPEQLQALFQELPVQDINLTPEDWEKQLTGSNDEAPVTGVSYMQALLYARAAGANLPTAEMQQSVRATNPPTAELEWTRSEMESPLPGIYSSPVYLLVDKDGRIIPTDSRDKQHARCGFRISFSENTP